MKATCEQGQNISIHRSCLCWEDQSWRLIWIRWNQLGKVFWSDWFLWIVDFQDFRDWTWFLLALVSGSHRPLSHSHSSGSRGCYPCVNSRPAIICAFQPYFLIVSLRPSRAVIKPMQYFFFPPLFPNFLRLGMFFPCGSLACPSRPKSDTESFLI